MISLLVIVGYNSLIIFLNHSLGICKCSSCFTFESFQTKNFVPKQAGVDFIDKNFQLLQKSLIFFPIAAFFGAVGQNFSFDWHFQVCNKFKGNPLRLEEFRLGKNEINVGLAPTWNGIKQNHLTVDVTVEHLERRTMNCAVDSNISLFSLFQNIRFGRVFQKYLNFFCCDIKAILLWTEFGLRVFRLISLFFY